MARRATLVIGRIEDQGNVVAIYPPSAKIVSMSIKTLGEYHVLASRRKATGLKVGDKITYEPVGVNVGYFVSKSN